MRVRERAAVVLVAVVVPLLVWSVARLSGIDVQSIRRAEVPRSLPWHYVLIVAAIFSLLGWAKLAVLERWLPRHARAVWVISSLGAVSVALVRVVSWTDLSGVQRLVLALMAVAVAAVIVPLLPRGLGAAKR